MGARIMLSAAPSAGAGKSRRRLRGPAALRDCTSGLAMIEFAMSLPVVLMLGLLGLETANFAMAHLRVSNIAMVTADNAARIRDVIDEADVTDILTGAKDTGASMNFAQNGRIILTDLEPTPTGGNQWIRWQRCDGALNYTNANTAWRPPGICGLSRDDDAFRWTQNLNWGLQHPETMPDVELPIRR